MSEYIISTSQIEEINKAHYGMKIVTSWLSCYAIWDTSQMPPLMKSEHLAITLPTVVRCRDCKEFSFGNTANKTVDWCNYWFDCVDDPGGFCAWGERRKDE